MGDEPLLPLNTHKYSRVGATTAQIPATTAKRRQRETIAEIWPEISFRQKKIWLGVLLKKLRQHFKQQLDVTLVRCGDEVRFQLEDTDSLDTFQLTLAEACQILEQTPGSRGQLLDQEC